MWLFANTVSFLKTTLYGFFGGDMILGTCTISGQFPVEVDGLFLGFRPRRIRFDVTTKGLLRQNKLYKTHDGAMLAELLGIDNAKVTYNYNAVLRQKIAL
jgi:hypothetical protein